MIMVLGPKSAGKTSLLKRLAGDKDCEWSGKRFDQSCPCPQTTTGIRTGGFNTPSGQRIAVREIGPTMYPMSSSYLDDAATTHVMYMIDGTNRLQIAEASCQFRQLLVSDKASQLKIALVVNKCDCREALTNAEIKDYLNLDQLAANMDESRHPALFKISVLSNAGIADLVKWMSS